MRALLYSHDGQGLGHVRRNLALAGALTAMDDRASALVVCSSEHVDALAIPARVDVLKLPGLRKVANGHYASKRLVLADAETWSMRSGVIASATRAFAPEVMVSDKHPHGAGGELREALGVLRSAGGRAVLGLRDILDDPGTVRAEWARSRVMAAVASDYDRVLVYGTPAVLDPVRAYGMPRAVAELVRFCGYVATPPATARREPLRDDDDPRPTVLATAGAGGDGTELLRAFLEQSRGAPWHPVVVAGGDAPLHEQERLERSATAVGGTFHRSVRDLSAHFGEVAAVVCMGGYNTTVEALAASAPTVVVPRVAPRQEQLLRARAFARMGLLQVVHPHQLDGDRLGLAVRAAVVDPRPRVAAAVRRHLDLGGASRAAAHLLALAGEREATVALPARELVDVAV